MLTETDRAEIAALVEEALAGRGREAVTARPATPTRRPVRLGRAEGPAIGERPAFSPSDGLAELGRSLAELRVELAERLDYETEQRERLAQRIHEMLEQPRGGGQNGGGQNQVQGVPPVRQEGQEGSGAPNGGSAGGQAGSKPGGASTAQPQWAEPSQEPGQDGPSSQGASSSPASGAGGNQAQQLAHQGTAQKLARANFDLAEALNENLRNLKEIVDRSQELVARIENILRRQARGRQEA